MSELTDYLVMMAEFGEKASDDKDYLYSSYEELVLANGVLYTEARVDVSGPIKECFTNAFYAAAEHDDWTYVEGYAASVIPVQHAWCLDGDGVVVETTWPDAGTEYYGIPFALDWVMKTVANTGYWGILGNDWTQDLTLLRHGLAPEALITKEAA